MSTDFVYDNVIVPFLTASGRLSHSKKANLLKLIREDLHLEETLSLNFKQAELMLAAVWLAAPPASYAC